MNAVNSNNIDEIYRLLTSAVKKSRVKRNVNMAKYTSFKAGGEASLLVVPKNEEELGKIMKAIHEEDCEYFIMGNGTNVLVRDGGYEGVIINIGSDMNNIERQGQCLIVSGGALLSAVAKQALYHSLTGFEFASGIPGSMGGAAAMNAGAYGGEIKDVMISAKVMDTKGNVLTIEKDHMDFGYRRSVFQDKNYIVLEATLQFEEEDKKIIKDRMRALTKQRNEKQPVLMPSAGSFFKRPEGTYAGKLIEEAQLKGLKLGGAQVSELHANFIVNTGNATAADIINLMALVQKSIMEQTDILLEPEVKIIGKL